MEAKGAFYDATSVARTSNPSSSSTPFSPQTRAAGVSVEEDTAASLASSSPLSGPAKSPGDSAGRLGSATPSMEQDAPEASATAHQPRRVSSSAKSGLGRDKRKRSRVTPEQLVRLERFFEADRSPTAARRKEISQLLGMQERQTQIWFQNRRAKAKLLDGKGKTKPGSTPPRTPPDLHQSYETDLHKLIHEEDAITIIPCYELTIGTWRRIASHLGKHDLVTYACENRRCLVWYIQSSGYGFKIEVPFEYIKEVTYQATMPGRSLASFYLTQPPLFFIEDLVSADSALVEQRIWKRSADWTESSQASHELRHDIVGSSVQLAQVLRHYNLPLTSSSDSQAHSPPTSIPTPPTISSASAGFDSLPSSGVSDQPPYNHGYYDQGSTLRSSAVNPIEVQRRPSYSPFSSAVGMESLEYSGGRDSVPPSSSSLQPSPALSYTSYPHVVPSPLQTSLPFSSSSPGPPISHYPSPSTYPSHGALEDVTQMPPTARGYGVPVYTNVSAISPASASHPHFHGYGIPAPSPSPHLMGAIYATRPDPRTRASPNPNLVPQQPSGMVSDPNMLSSVSYDDGLGHQQHHY